MGPENPSVFVVFDGCEPDSQIIAVADSLESAIDVIDMRYSLSRENAHLLCRWSDSWQYAIKDRRFAIDKHYVKSF